ncbi:DUF3168 domain-containing protein [Psychromarinibacter sp. C21-152]|uniref:DUF3168 domain-containing protein n=1 Tax=Psychromarinibacter sediminicola TaxID=3033385 RepID=A0AAE3T9V7_9RHOB|nr:DUF3168 domain-containing protein [Psychromarinibacter sediminicola]MDF0600940.1 DUF3168 domain-containing protein [Psychromarinibacter sediminicola]
MSYGVASALQAAVYQHLQADAALAALVGDAIFDAAPAGEVPALYVALGPEDVRAAGDATGAGARHDFTVSVVSGAAGFHAAKAAAAAVSDALVDAGLTLARGRLVRLGFLKARARRAENGTQRQIDLRFRARVEAD